MACDLDQFGLELSIIRVMKEGTDITEIESLSLSWKCHELIKHSNHSSMEFLGRAAPELVGAAREDSDLRVAKAEGFRNNLRRWRRWPTFNLA
jgi:hypothetical protein